ncbi:hypothetical protein LL200_000551 [Salmonella enterica]|nr:hypothetical protein [Salmonella enterica]
MLVVYSEVMTKAPRYLQQRFLETANRKWGFRAPYSDETLELEQLALGFSLQALWGVIGLRNAGCDPLDDYFSVARIRSVNPERLHAPLTKECIGYVEGTPELRKDFNTACCKLWSELDRYPGEIVWLDRRTCLTEIGINYPVRLVSLNVNDLTAVRTSAPEEITPSPLRYSLFKQGDAWILPPDLNQYLLMSDQIHSGYDATVTEYALDFDFAKKFLR